MRSSLGSRKDRRTFSKHNDHDLNDTQEIRCIILPIRQIGKIDSSIRIHMFSLFDHHVRGWFDVTDGRRVRVIIGNVDGNGYVVCGSLV